jgi:integrase/recombinase XerD
LVELSELFVRGKRYLANVTEKTITFYRQSFKAYKSTVGEVMPDRFVLNDFIIKRRERGMQPGGANVYIRGINSFLGWMWQNNYISERLSMKSLKEEKKTIPIYSEKELKAFINWKPKNWHEQRFYALLITLIDTGARIDIELLHLTRENVDMGNWLIKLDGMGSKQRFVPMSYELRKVLLKWLQMHEYDLVFPTKMGTKLRHRNVLRDLYDLGKKLGIDKPKFYKFRHTFAINYLRNGGGELYLQRALGHESLNMVRRYTQISEEDLLRMHRKTSLLSKNR